MIIQKSRLKQFSFLLLIILILQLRPEGFLPSPLEIFGSMVEQLRLESVQQNILKTTTRVYIATGISLVLGVAIGVADYFNGTISDITNGIFYPTQFVSEAVLTIIAIAVLGLNPVIIYLVTVIAIVPDVFIATQIALNNMDEKLLELGQIYSENKLSTFKHLVIPQILPYIFTGLIRAHATAWDIVATAEVFLALSGLGYLVQNEFRLLDLPDLFALVGIIVIVGLASDRVLRIIKKHVDRRYMEDEYQNQRIF